MSALAELSLIENHLSAAVYTDYDRLIQLCDHLAHTRGYCVVEQRMVDVALRYGIRDVHLAKWTQVLRIKSDFDARIGRPVYALLPGIALGTFGTDSLRSLGLDDEEWRSLRADSSDGRKLDAPNVGPNQTRAAG